MSDVFISHVEEDAAVALDDPPFRLGYYAAYFHGIEIGPADKHIEGEIPRPPERRRRQTFWFVVVHVFLGTRNHKCS